MNPNTGKPWVVEDLRNPTLKSGWRYVVKLPPHRVVGETKPYRGQRGVGGGATQRKEKWWYGPYRATGEEAAQDVCDYLNRTGTTAHPLLYTVPRDRERRPRDTSLRAAVLRSRGDATDLGPRAHDRRGTTVEQRHREQLIASGYAGVDVEFKPSGITPAEKEAALGKAFVQRLAGIEPPPFVLGFDYDELFEQGAKAMGIPTTWLNNSDIAEDGHFRSHE